MFRIKPHTCERYSEGSNKPCAHQDPETEPEQCLGVSCGGPGQQWTAAGAEALGAADPGVAQALLEEVTIKPPQSRQNLHRTGETDPWRAQTKPCAPGPRRGEQRPHKRLTQTCPWVSRSLQCRCGSAVACCRVGGTECSSACMGPLEGGRHYLHYLHHSLAQGK